MDNTTSPLVAAFHQRKQSRNGRKIRKPSRKEKEISPVKVVYISNPMKVSATASEFRDLVQRLTGQDAADLPDPSKFAADQTVSLSTVGADVVSADADEERLDAAAFDDVFTSQMMLESLLMPTAPGFCSFESVHLDMLMSLDAV